MYLKIRTYVIESLIVLPKPLKKIPLCLWFLCCTITDSLCQENIFINNNPTNNPDSLETWLKENPKPTITRLRNLFKLQKTYLWTTNEKSVVEEFGQLSKQLNN